MKAVFADTFYFLGLLNRADESHARCAAFANGYREAVVTSAYVLVELADGLAMPRYRAQTARFIQTLQVQPRVRIIPASDTLLRRGLELYAARPDKAWSLTDCISPHPEGMPSYQPRVSESASATLGKPRSDDVLPLLPWRRGLG